MRPLRILFTEQDFIGCSSSYHGYLVVVLSSQQIGAYNQERLEPAGLEVILNDEPISPVPEHAHVWSSALICDLSLSRCGCELVVG